MSTEKNRAHAQYLERFRRKAIPSNLRFLKTQYMRILGGIPRIQKTTFCIADDSAHIKPDMHCIGAELVVGANNSTLPPEAMAEPARRNCLKSRASYEIVARSSRPIRDAVRNGLCVAFASGTESLCRGGGYPRPLSQASQGGRG